MSFVPRMKGFIHGQEVRAVIWNVLPQPRMDAVLQVISLSIWKMLLNRLFVLKRKLINFQAQAKFIDMFTTESRDSNIWSNVIIISKGKVMQ